MSELPQALALRSRRRIIDDAVQGLGSSRGAHVSIRGGRFRLIDANGNEKLIDTHYIDLIIVDANDKPARIMWPGGPGSYSDESTEPPLCYSDNGVGPSVNAMQPQSPTCQSCQHNIRGTAQTFRGKPTTMCENRKKLAAIIPDDPAVNVYEFGIPPASLSNLRAYSQWLGQQATGVEGRQLDIADVVTRVAFDPDKQFVMTFNAAAFADDDRTMQLIQYIDDNKLSDAAVGRNDVACDPEQVRAMIAGRPAQGQIAAAGTVATQGREQQFTLPPRTAAPVVPAGNAPAAPAAPRTTRSTKKESQALPLPAPGAPTGQNADAPSHTAAASPSNIDIPDFLKRKPEGQAGNGAGAPTPRFGVGQAPPPPAEIQDALNKAMALPTRRG